MGEEMREVRVVQAEQRSNPDLVQAEQRSNPDLKEQRLL